MIGLGLGGRGIGLGLGRSAGAAAFVGAYDAIPNIVAAYGMRRLRSAYTGSVLRIRRSSDNAEQDIGYDGSGHLDTAAVATFIGAGSGYIVKWYDQSGNAYDASQTTAASQPLYVASGQNNRPVPRYDGVDDIMVAALTSGVAWSFFATLKTGNTLAQSSGQQIILGTNGPQPGPIRWGMIGAGNNGVAGLGWGGTGSDINLGSGAALAINTPYVRNAIKTSAYWRTYQNGQTVGSNPNDASNPSSNFVLQFGAEWGIAYPFPGDIVEVVICNAALSDANRQAAETAANNYWAIY